MSQSRVFGIDLGTTYSCIAYVDEHGRPVVVPNSDNQLTTPSVVYFESPDNIVVGQAAKEVAAVYSDKVVSTVKRVMGDPDWRFEAFGVDYSPQEVSSYILRKVVAEAEQQTGLKIVDVVITCPAYFGVNEKEATRQAGELAGLVVRYVIPEPTAAAIAYGIAAQGDQTVLIYDLGGGTFDVTIIRIESGSTTVICTGGDRQLGGRNWDETIVEYFMGLVEQATGKPIDAQMDDEEEYQDLLNLAEQCKQALSVRGHWTGKCTTGDARVTLTMTREQFDDLTRSLLTKTLSMTDLLLETARSKGHTRIDKLLLVGGSTYMPQVKAAVEAHYDFPVQVYEPNQAVAKGAARFGFKCDIDDGVLDAVAQKTGIAADEIDLGAIDAAVIAGAQREVARTFGLPPKAVKDLNEHTVRNVTSKSFGLVVRVEDDSDGVVNLISMNDPVPVTITRMFSTYTANQESVDLRLMENQMVVGRDDTLPIESCTQLRNSVLTFERTLPAGSPIEVRFDLTADGMLKVHARDVTTGRVLDMKHETNGVLAEEEQALARERSQAMRVS